MGLVVGWYLKRLNGDQQVVRLWAADTNFRLRVLSRHSIEGGHEVPTLPDHRSTDEQLVHAVRLSLLTNPPSLSHWHG